MLSHVDDPAITVPLESNYGSQLALSLLRNEEVITCHESKSVTGDATPANHIYEN